MNFFSETETETPPAPGSVFALGYGDPDTTRFVSSREKLAQALGCGVRTVATMLSEPGNPGRTQNGSYDLAKWKTYFAARKNEIAGDDCEDSDFALTSAPGNIKQALQSELLRERRAKADLAELNAAARRGELVELASVKKEVASIAASLRAFHHREMTVEAVNVLAFRLALDDNQVGALVEFMEEFHLAFCKKISEWGAVSD